MGRPNNSPVQTAPIQITCPKSKLQKCSLNFELSDNNNNNIINIVSPKINKTLSLSRSFKKTFRFEKKKKSQILISLPQISKLSRLWLMLPKVKYIHIYIYRRNFCIFVVLVCYFCLGFSWFHVEGFHFSTKWFKPMLNFSFSFYKLQYPLLLMNLILHFWVQWILEILFIYFFNWEKILCKSFVETILKLWVFEVLFILFMGFHFLSCVEILKHDSYFWSYRVMGQKE